MIRHFLYILLAVIVTLLSSCSREEIVCDPGKLAVVAVGFTETDFDSAIVTRYMKGQSFSSIVDTAGVEVQQKGADTLRLFTVRYAAKSPIPYPSGFLEYGYDYKLYIPRLQRFISFSDITLDGNTHRTVRRGLRDNKYYDCTNSVVSCVVDGVPTSVRQNEPDGVVYIRK